MKVLDVCNVFARPPENHWDMRKRRLYSEQVAACKRLVALAAEEIRRKLVQCERSWPELPREEKRLQESCTDTNTSIVVTNKWAQAVILVGHLIALTNQRVMLVSGDSLPTAFSEGLGKLNVIGHGGIIDTRVSANIVMPTRFAESRNDFDDLLAARGIGTENHNEHDYNAKTAGRLLTLSGSDMLLDPTETHRQVCEFLEGGKESA